MTSIGDLYAIGEKLGLREDKLLEFIENERTKEEKRRLEDMERQERAAERELKKLQMELELEHERNKGIEQAHDSTRAARNENKSTARAPKLPHFQEDKDDMDAYLERFERYAESQEWKHKD